MKEILDKVLNTLKVIGKEIYFFISSQIFLKNFAGIAVLVSLLLFITFWWMRCYTKHGESLQVHDYTMMSLEDAIEKAKDRSFDIVVNDSTYRRGIEPNTVLTQSPKPFSRVKENRKIYLTITKTEADLVRLPDLRGNYDYNNYSRKLGRLEVDAKIRKRQFSSKEEINTILKVYYKGEEITDQISEGIQVKKGSTIEFIVSEKGGGRVQIPDLVCMKFTEAEFNVKNYDLSIGSIIPDATVTDQNNAYVWKQTPKFRKSSKLKIGSQVDIYITQNIPENCISGSESNETTPPQNPDTGEGNEDF